MFCSCPRAGHVQVARWQDPDDVSHVMMIKCYDAAKVEKEGECLDFLMQKIVLLKEKPLEMPIRRERIVKKLLICS